jgi:hypothetical protein
MPQRAVAPSLEGNSRPKGTSLRYVHPITERKRAAAENIIRTMNEGRREEVCHNPATEEEGPAARLALSA